MQRGKGVMITASAVILCLLVVYQVILLAPQLRQGKPIRKSRYDVNLSRFTSLQTMFADNNAIDLKKAASQLETTYVPLHMDESIEKLLNEALVVTFASRVVANLKHVIYSTLLYFGWSHSDAAGLVRQAKLYVASTQQFQTMLPKMLLPTDSSQVLQVVDVGSGSGTETAKLAKAIHSLSNNPFQVNVTCFESAKSLRYQLRARGFTVAHSLDDLEDNTVHVGVLLNVLDRCDNPVDLVQAMLQKLKTSSLPPASESNDGGYLIVGIVLPFKGGRVLEGKWGALGKSASRRPRNRLLLPSVTITKKRKGWIEFQAAHFYAGLLRRIPELQVVRWTRLPYVSVGGNKWTHSTLDMMLLVLRQQPTTPMKDYSEETTLISRGEDGIFQAEMVKTEL